MSNASFSDDGWPSPQGAVTDTQGNVGEFTVSELSAALKRSVEAQFGYVRLRAELSGVKRAASGHMYFALKDERAALDGVCWRGVASRLSFRPEDGLEVVVTGKLTTYPARSKYQLVVESMAPAGVGALMALLEERRKKLSAEGLFDDARKKPLPYLPTVIGVVTSPTGAVIRDILHRLRDRFPSHVIVWPVRVQGQGADREIAAGITGLAKGGPGMPIPDVIIVARGGGSIEDLWCFNEESVVRAAAACPVPLISAVGHETDWTLIDHAADRRAPTPTGAAEMAVPVRSELMATVRDLARRLGVLGVRGIEDRRERVAGLARGLPSATAILGMASQRLDDLSERLPRALKAVAAANSNRLLRTSAGLSLPALVRIKQQATKALTAGTARLHPAYSRYLEQLSQRLQASARMLETLSYQRTLERGFVLVEDADGAPLVSAEAAAGSDRLTLQFADGRVAATTRVHAQTRQRPARPKSATKSPDVQASLFDDD